MVTVTLGSFTFADFEIPEHIPFGTEQALVVHKLIGGTKQVDAMGATPSQLSFSGWFTGSNALTRAEQLQTLVQTGTKVSLTWDALSYTVLVQSIACDYKLPWRIPYTVTCEPISNDSQPVSSTTSTDTDQIVSDDVDSSTTLATSVGDSTLTSNVSTVSTEIAALGTLASASLASIKAVNQSISVAQTQAAVVQAETTATLSAASGSFDTTPSGLAAFASALTGAASASANSSDLVVLGATLSRIATNLTSDTNGVKTITVTGGDLFTVAAQEYGDATMWTVIANANGLTDPFLSGVTQLIIPPAPSSSNGGILNA